MLKNILILVSGSGGAHLISLACLPFLTRLFGPEQFSYLAAYVAIISICSCSFGLRYEIAIPIAKTRRQAAILCLLSIGISAFLNLISIPFILFFSQFFEATTSLNGVLLLLIPAAIFCATSYNSLQFWCTRSQRFNDIARTRIVQSASGNLMQLTSGFWGSTSGLIFGHFLYVSSGVMRLTKEFWASERKVIDKLKYKEFFLVARRYKSFPFYSTPEVLFNTAGVQFPIILITTFSISSEAGFLLLAIKVMQAPMSLLGSSIAQVFYSEISKTTSQENVSTLVISTISALLKYGVTLIIITGVVAEPLFSFIFGVEWRRAGELVAWCTPWFVFQFLASPISMIMHASGKQKSMLILTLFGGTIRVLTVIVFIFFRKDYVAEAYAVTGAVFYALCFTVFTGVAGLNLSLIITSIFKGNEKYYLCFLTLLLLIIYLRSELYV